MPTYRIDREPDRVHPSGNSSSQCLLGLDTIRAALYEPHRRQVTPRSSGPKLLVHHSRNVELPKQRLPLLPDIVELVERARSEARDDLNNALLGGATCDVTFALGVTESGEGGRRNYKDNVAQLRERYQGLGHAAHQRWAVSSPVQESWSRSIRRAPS